MRVFYLLFILMITVLCCQRQKKTTIKNELVNRLDSLIEGEHSANRFDGTVVVGTKDSAVYTKAVGTANRVWNISLRMDHRFDIASVNKSFIAALTMKAVEERRLSLDDKLADLLSAYDYQGNFDPQIILHQMLTHTSGLPDYQAVDPKLSENNFARFKRMHFSNSEYVDFISQLKPHGKPDRQFYYSNFAYHLLAIILEDLYQRSFSEILMEKICEPLQLDHTFSSASNEEIHEELVEAYNYDENDKKWHRNNFIDLTLGRRIFSTSKDLYHWAKAMDDTTFLSARSLQLMTSNHLGNITNDISYGYGWAVLDGNGEYQMGNLGIDQNYIIHGGATEGYRSMLINIEHGKWIIAFLSNVGDSTNEMELTKKIVNILNQSENEN